MRFFVSCFLLLAAQVAAAQSIIHEPFVQETRVLYMTDEKLVHNPKHLLPVENVFQIDINDDGTILAWAGNSELLLNHDGTGPGEYVKDELTMLEYNGIEFQAVEDGILILPTASIETLGKILSHTKSPHLDFVVGNVNGLFIQKKEKEQFTQLYPDDGHYSWAPKNVTAVAYDSKGRLWFACRQGVGSFDGKNWKLYTGAEGLPYDHITCVAGGDPDGAIWFGTEKGAIRFDGENWSYRASLRWLPDDYVNDIAVAADGTAWIATRKGISRIDRRPITLDQKAKHFNDLTEQYNNRDGYIATWALKRRGDITSATPGITDNDGQYTSMYGAAQSFRYAVTKSPEAKAQAKRSFEACKFLVDVVPQKMYGFVARVAIPIDWHEPVNEQYGKKYNLKKREGDALWKQITPRFPKSDDGKWRWKCDTSSDELAGHFFLYPLYYDLVAETEEEKQPVREVVAAIVDYLIKHNYNLIDHDGTPTRWGRFGPEDIAGKEEFAERALNSMMMLSMLKVAEHVTGDEKYAKEAKRLRDEYGYHINMLTGLPTFPPENRVPWDNNLYLLTFYPLMMYEEDPELLILFRQSLETTWGYISRQKNATWNMIYAACADRYAKLVADDYFADAYPDNPHYTKQFTEMFAEVNWPQRDSLEMLQNLPLELLGWKMENSHRLDVEADPTPFQDPGYGWRRADGRALPISERAHVRQDRDATAIDYQEGDGKNLHEGTLYLLPYWMGRYHQYIE